MIRVVVAGISSRVGTAVAKLIQKNEDLLLVGGIEHSGHPSVGQKIVELGCSPVEHPLVLDDLSDILGSADVVVNFADPQIAMGHLQFLARVNEDNVSVGSGYFYATVLGYADLSIEQLNGIRKLAEYIPIVQLVNATGTVLAAKWVATQPPGLYSENQFSGR